MIVKIMSITENMKDCLIIGRSPFVNQVKWDKVDFKRFFVICINYPVPDIPVDIVIARDETPKPVLAPLTQFISPRTGYYFTNEPKEDKDIMFVCYTSSSAVYIAQKMGFNRGYLIGIDHIEDDKPFTHYDGIINKGVATSFSNKLCKDYICSVRGISLYQTNPTVKPQWDLPFMDIATLYR